MNIPTAEYQSVLDQNLQRPLKLHYPRNTDLDPQLVWRGKDEQDWSDLVVQAPPLYIQEKVHPKALIDDLLRRSRQNRADEPGSQLDLFADFNGMAEGADRTEFYQHDQNWSNRMILGDSLQVKEGRHRHKPHLRSRAVITQHPRASIGRPLRREWPHSQKLQEFSL